MTMLAGDSVKVDTDAYLNSKPALGDIVAIGDHRGIRIKRIAGLPGETMSVSPNGLLLHNEVELSFQNQWLLVHDDSYRRASLSWWHAQDGSLWNMTASGFDSVPTVGPSTSRMLVYGHRSIYANLKPDRVRDDYPGNVTEIRKLRQVDRLGIEANVHAKTDGMVRWFQWRESGVVCQENVLRKGDYPIWIEWEESDRLKAFPFPNAVDANHPVGVEVVSGEISLTSLKVYRQFIYWVDESRGDTWKFPFKLGPDEYFVVGDNVPLSIDSRQEGPVLRKRIAGQVLLDRPSRLAYDTMKGNED